MVIVLTNIKASVDLESMKMHTIKIRRDLLSLRFLTLIVLILVANQIYGKPTVPPHNSSHLTGGKGYLAFVRSNNIWLYNVANHRQFQIVTNGDLPCWIQNKSALAFTRNSNLYLYRFPLANSCNLHTIPMALVTSSR